MGCGCGKNRVQHEVVTTDGKVVYSSTNKHTAQAVSKRYPGSEVRESGVQAGGKAAVPEARQAPA